MIVFILKTGQREALPYSDLRRLSFNPSEGITLTYIECIITITGRRLDQGFQKLASQRVVFIAEADHATGKLVEDGDPVITGLVIAEKQVMPRFSSQFEDK
ncbi:hypothetical protein [Roseimaritima multifibrata]|nr:hypothetical protein [Roseimaritima multifibrata]